MDEPTTLPPGAAGLVRLATWHEGHAEYLDALALETERGPHGNAPETMRAHAAEHRAWAADLRARAGVAA